MWFLLGSQTSGCKWAGFQKEMSLASCHWSLPTRGVLQRWLLATQEWSLLQWIAARSTISPSNPSTRWTLHMLGAWRYGPSRMNDQEDMELRHLWIHCDWMQLQPMFKHSMFDSKRNAEEYPHHLSILTSTCLMPILLPNTAWGWNDGTLNQMPLESKSVIFPYWHM